MSVFIHPKALIATITSAHFRQLMLVIFIMPLVILLGLLAPRYGLAIILMPLFVAAILLILIDLDIGLVMFVALLPLESVVLLGGEVTWIRILGIVLFGVWIVRTLLHRKPFTELLTDRLILALLIFGGLAMLSGLWASFKSVFIIGFTTLVQLLFLVVLIIDLVKSWGTLDYIAKGLVLGGTVATFLSINQYFTEGLIRAGSGIAGGVNGTAVMLVTLIPFAFYLLRGVDRLFWRLLGITYILLAAVAVAVSFSRSSYLLFIFALAIQYGLQIRSRIGRLSLLILAIGLILVVVYVVPKKPVFERAGTIGSYITTTLNPDESTFNGEQSARGFHWRVGLAVFRDSPILGVGFRNFPNHFVKYQFRVPGADRIWDKPRSSHNSYISILAELGVVGLFFWMAVLGVALSNWLKVSSFLSTFGSFKQQALSRAFSIAFILQLAIGLAGNIHNEKILWLLLAVSLVCKGLVDEAGKQSDLNRSQPNLLLIGKATSA